MRGEQQKSKDIDKETYLRDTYVKDIDFKKPIVYIKLLNINQVFKILINYSVFQLEKTSFYFLINFLFFLVLFYNLYFLLNDEYSLCFLIDYFLYQIIFTLIGKI